MKNIAFSPHYPHVDLGQHSHPTGHGGGVVAHKILVSAPVPLELILTGFDWVGAGPWGFGFWDGA